MPLFSLLTTALSWLPIPCLSSNQVRSVVFFWIVVDVDVDVDIAVVGGCGVVVAVTFSTVNIPN